MLIDKSMCSNLWESTLEMEGITPYFGAVLNLGWKRRKWWKVCNWEEEIASVSCGPSAVLGEMVQEGKNGTVYKELKREMKENSIFNYVSSEAHVHCLKTDFEILSMFELEQENSFPSVFHLTCIQSRFGWVPHLSC